ncbi:MAG: hypothetical protein ACT4PV_02125 [Planctomycetaceae bacterium]
MRGTTPLVVLVLGSAAERAGCPRESSPLGRAAKPHLDRLAHAGRVHAVRLANSASDLATAAPLLSILGIDPQGKNHARASCLAARAAPAPGPDGCYASAQFISLFRELLADPEPAGISAAESEVLVGALEEPLRRAGARLAVGEGGRLLVSGPRSLFDPATPPPDHLLGADLRRFEPRAAPHALLHRLSREVLDGHDVNAVRRDLGRNGADMLWISGPGAPAVLPSVPEAVGGPAGAAGDDGVFRGACVAAGIALQETPPGDAAALVGAARRALATDRLFFLHWRRGLLDACQRDLATRAEGIGELDRTLVGPRAEAIAAARGRLLVIPDLARDTASGRPLADCVPALVWGAGVQALSSRRFDEAGAAASGDPLEPGHGLLAYVLNL